MNIRKTIIALLIGSSMVIMNGCAVFTPYKENVICKVPEGQGYCGSLSDGYEYSINRERM